jgi:hypothetical protein
MVEHPGAETRRRPQQIANHRRNAPAHAVERRIVAGQSDKAALQVESDDATFRQSRREAQARRAGATADIENKLPRLGGNRGGEENRIDRDTCTACQLPQPDAAAEERVLGQGRSGTGIGRGQRSSSSAAAITAPARR